ncbi:hypothetical protein SCHPADRAFT_910315 [Schizopora paradoxa]|uniref:Uncharacterized protein n=1 Tax=Schizopora paradoxa TaxID=27342 RepID=A0A0H2R402_9AGAM|nr:hypothetical protein SCHPADRAFT_910315 [Schizopora paradoxa]
MSDSDSSRKPNAGKTISIATFPNELLCHIFEFSLWTIVTKPITSKAAAADHLSRTPPYNIQFTCRAWREIVLSRPSLWTSIFFAVDFPSKRDLLPLERIIKRHLQRAEDLPLACFLEFSKRCEMSGGIAMLLAENERRWDFVTSHTAQFSGRNTKPLLHVKSRSQMVSEKLILHFTKTYQVSERESGLFRSLTHLEFEIHPSTDYSSVLDVLRLAPNLLYLCILSIHFSDSVTMGSEIVSYPNVVSLPYLLLMGVPKPTPLAEAILRYTRCPALNTLFVGFGGIDCDTILTNFLFRSSPTLEMVYLNFEEMRHSSMAQIAAEDGFITAPLSFDAFALAPFVRDFRLTWSLSMDSAALFRVLSEAKSIFPALEDLELACVSASPEQYNQLVSARWHDEPRALKSITLIDSRFKLGLVSESLKFPKFKVSDEPSTLPATFGEVQSAIVEGLRFTSTYSVWS